MSDLGQVRAELERQRAFLTALLDALPVVPDPTEEEPPVDPPVEEPTEPEVPEEPAPVDPEPEEPPVEVDPEPTPEEPAPDPEPEPEPVDPEPEPEPDPVEEPPVEEPEAPAVAEMPRVVAVESSGLWSVAVFSTATVDAAGIVPESVQIGTAAGMFPAHRAANVLRTVTKGGVVFYLAPSKLGTPLPAPADIVLTGTHPLAGAIRAHAGVPLPAGPVAPPSAPVTPTEPTAPVVRLPLPDPAGPYPLDEAELATFPDAETAFALGPQLKSGSALNPWPAYDRMTAEQLLRHGRAYPERIIAADGSAPVAEGITGPAYLANYYDLALGLAVEYHRSGDEEFRDLFHKVADAFHGLLVYDKRVHGGTAPRNMSLCGIILRAHEGRPEWWPYITAEVKRQLNAWIGLRIAYPGLYMGIRDGAYMLQFTVWVSQMHPDAAVRDEFRALADRAVHDYYLRLQREDGSWYWEDDSGNLAPENTLLAQPFMVGLLLDSLTDYHRATGDAATAAAIPRALDWLWPFYRLDRPVTTDHAPTKPRVEGVYWRNFPYFVYPDGRSNDSTKLAGDWDTNTLREARQANSDIVAHFGYAYQLTGDTKYRERGDEVFASTFGAGEGPGADAFYNLMDYDAKALNQAGRSAGHYLVLRRDR